MKTFSISRFSNSKILILSFSILFILSLVSVGTSNYIENKNTEYELSKKSAHYYSENISTEIIRIFANIEECSKTLKLCFENKDFSQIEVEKILKEYLNNNKDVFASAFGYNPDTSNNISFCPYYFKNNGTLEYKNLAEFHYNYYNWDWFKKAADSKKIYWTEPYFDKGGGNVYMITCSTPIYNSSGKFLGVFTNDINLDLIREKFEKINHIKNASIVILNSKNEVIYPYNPLKTNSKIETEFTTLKINSNSSYKVVYSLNSKSKGLLFVNNLSTQNWKIAVFIPENSIINTKKILHLNDIIFIITILLLFTFAFITISSVTKKINTVNLISDYVAKGKIADASLFAQQLLKKYNLSNRKLNEKDIKNELVSLVLNINSMILNLDDLVLQSQKAGRQVNNSVEQINSVAKDIDNVLLNLNSTIEEIAKSSDSIVNKTEASSNQLMHLANISKLVNDDAMTGKTSLDKMGIQLIQINEGSHLVRNVLEKMHSETEGISDVISEINNIAHRTNMLSINVEIEVEKTSAILLEKGLNINIGGFKIVAGKINELALKTAESAVNIENKIANIDDTIKEIINSVMNYLELISHTSLIINDVSFNLTNIIQKSIVLTNEFGTFQDDILLQNSSIYNISELIKSILSCSENIQNSMQEFSNQIELANSSTIKMQSSLQNFSTDKSLI